MLQQHFTTQLRRLARRWHIHGTSFPTDFQPVLTELIDAHRSNIQDHAHWTSASLQRTIVFLSSWVVIPADHFPSRAHVICPSLFATLMHKTFCTGIVFSLCRESAASFRSEVVTTIPALLQQRYAWGLRLQALLPTARILPKPTKDWLKARPIISFFRTWAAPLLTVFGALIFELTKVTFPDVPGQLSVQELVQQLWDALSHEEPTEYIHLVSQDLSGFFTSIPTERFHQALQVLLHRYDQVVGLRRSSHWSVYEVKSDHRRRMFKGKWRRQTKVPRTFREQDLRCLLDFVIDNSHFEINGYLFRQERGVAMLPCCFWACGVLLDCLSACWCLVSSCACMCAVGSDVLDSCILELLHLSMAEYVVSSLLRPDGTVQTTSQVALDQLPNLIAMRCSSLSRRMASCTFAMFRHTALHAVFGHSALHVTSERCMIMSLRGVHDLLSHVDPGLAYAWTTWDI